ncbi:cytochrome P450 [Streptomyces collinus]|uniref:Cytochrome P450 n=1 Tax=Streptomyces collinus (strain DSM 40733 / Tue 365) TaxID=1214242 RepID=S5ULJ2_STRC3|nr:cytochrome P450 [Streptomyces collinus]AGS67783.1 cytochrome P450 [Streptomyces collinus Tu 365]UJA06413.1 cytochrome P450 [Streptomyces collinus]UJA12417.1 cytochrome P450 [Streptomyces collinus]UJA12716.1 cytochrome P450 [Streptomyces collinus]UJA12720.1 cytochrome P450 [Streptomyces collinus]
MSDGKILFRGTLDERTVSRSSAEPAATVVPMRMGTAGVGLLVNDHGEATRILSDVETYGSAGELMASVFDEPAESHPDAASEAVFAVNQTDGEEHRRVRRALRRVIDARVRDVSDQLIQDVQQSIESALALGRLDAVASIGVPVADSVMSRLLGLDANLVSALRNAVYQGYPVRELDATLVDWVRDRRAHPADDLVSDLMAELPSLDDRQVAANTRLLALSGVEVLAALITNGILCLAQDPGTQSLVREDETLLPGLVHEVQRYASPIARGIYRMTKRSSVIGKYSVPAGTLLVIGVDVCNRDTSAFPDAHRFDPTRGRDFEHLTFGRGRHSCLGIPVTRLIAMQALRMFLSGTTRFGLTVEPSELRFHETMVMNGLVELPIWVECAD